MPNILVFPGYQKHPLWIQWPKPFEDVSLDNRVLIKNC